MEAFDKMDITLENSAKMFVARLLEICVEYGKTEYGRKLADRAREKFGNDVIKSDVFQGYLRNISKRIKTKEEVRDGCCLITSATYEEFSVPSTVVLGVSYLLDPSVGRVFGNGSKERYRNGTERYGNGKNVLPFSSKRLPVFTVFL